MLLAPRCANTMSGASECPGWLAFLALPYPYLLTQRCLFKVLGCFDSCICRPLTVSRSKSPVSDEEISVVPPPIYNIPSQADRCEVQFGKGNGKVRRLQSVMKVIQH